MFVVNPALASCTCHSKFAACRVFSLCSCLRKLTEGHPSKKTLYRDGNRLVVARPWCRARSWKLVDYIVIHELVHAVHHNHSKRFWKKVEKILPDYKEYNKWLRKHGQDECSRSGLAEICGPAAK